MNGSTDKSFYGWRIVTACCLLSFVAAIVSIHMLNEFQDAIDESFVAADPSYNASIWSYGLARCFDSLIIGIVAAPFIGLLLDRFGPRRLMLSGIAAAAIGFLLITQVQNDWHKQAATMLIAVGFAATTGIVLFATLGKWFARRRVLVFALLAASPAAAGLFILYFRSDLIEFFGWQTMAVASGVLLLVVGIPVAVIMRRRPEDYGSLPEGETSSTKFQHSSRRSEGTAFRTILRDRAFWQINLAIGLSLAMMSYPWIDPSSIGFFDNTIREVLLTSYAAIFFSIVCILIVGFVSLRRKSTNLVVAMLVIMAVSHVGTTFVHFVDELPFEYRLYSFFSVGSAVAGASLLFLQFAVLAEYFGTAKLGTAVGFAFGINAAMNLVFRTQSGYAIDVFAIDADAYNLIVLMIALLVYAVATVLILKLESQSRVAARLRLAQRSR